MGRHARISLAALSALATRGDWKLYQRTDRTPTPPYRKIVLLAPEGRRYHLDWNEQAKHVTGNATNFGVLKQRHPEMLPWLHEACHALK